MIKPWSALEFSEWKDTYETLHRWLQIVGKLRLTKAPWTNHSWHSTFYLNSRGITTSAIPLGDRNLTIEFNFIQHKLTLEDSNGMGQEFDLQSESVASFYNRFKHALEILDVDVSFDLHPNEMADDTPFDQDTKHKTYNKEQVLNCYQILVRIDNVLQKFRSRFVGKCSPVHLFWGSFDLAVTRFSGRSAPDHPGGIPHIPKEVVEEAYSHEVSSCGFWPGNDIYPHAAFYSYAYPEPTGLDNAIIEPAEAFFHKELREFILPYDKVRTASNPEYIILDFFQSTYEAAAVMADWDTKSVEESPHLKHLQFKHQHSLT